MNLLSALDLKSRHPNWAKRKNFRYSREVRSIVSAAGGDAKTMLEVGSNGCPYLEWFRRMVCCCLSSDQVSADGVPLAALL
jgi:hypothetical protein